MKRFTIFFFLVACSDNAIAPQDSGTPDVTLEASPADVSTPDVANEAADDDASDAAVADATDAADAADAADAGCLTGYEFCGGKCVDITTYQTDGKNCGFCAHDCQGNSCTKGLCAPDTIGTGLPNPYGLAVNSSTVYFTTSGDSSATGGSVYQCPVTGCPVKLGPMTASLNNPVAITIDSTSVYWDNAAGITGTNGSVMSCPLSDCGKNNGSRKTLAKSLTFTQGIAVDSTNVYFGTWGVSPYYGNGIIDSCPLAGCSGTPTSVMTGQSKPIFIALDGSTLFMAPIGGSTSIPYIESGPIPGPSAGTKVFTATISDSINGMAIYSSYIYFADGFAGSVDKCTESSCTTPVVLTTSTSNPTSMAVDSAGVYWIDDAGIETCPLAGCPYGKPLLLATSSNFPQNVAINGNYVYWVEQDSGGTAGEVLRVAR